jgi:hypothetical protein
VADAEALPSSTINSPRSKTSSLRQNAVRANQDVDLAGFGFLQNFSAASASEG